MKYKNLHLLACVKQPHANQYQSKRTKGGCDVNTDSSNETCDFEMNDRNCLAITDSHWGVLLSQGCCVSLGNLRNFSNNVLCPLNEDMVSF